MSNCLRDESPKVMNTNEFVDKNVEVSLLGNEGSLKRWLRSSLKSSRMSERSVAAKKGSFLVKFESIFLSIGVGHRSNEVRFLLYSITQILPL